MIVTGIAPSGILPRLFLDFTSASLDARITFTRSGATATRVNSSGYIETVAANTARFDFDPVTLLCSGLLIEESRVNSSLYSNDVTQTGWTLGGLTTSTPTTSPDGTANAVLLLEDSSTGFHRAFRVITTTSAAWTTSAYFKKAGRDWVWLRMSDSGGIKYAWFNISNGTIGTVQSGLTAKITNAGNGFYRCEITATTAANGSAAIIFGTADANDGLSFTGDPTKGIYFFGFQVEQGTPATSYIPTTTGTVTRNPDVAVMTGTNFSSWWTAVIGAAAAKYIPNSVTSVRPILEFDDGTANESIVLRGNGTNPELYIVDGGADQAQIDAGTIAANTTYTLVGAWNTNSCAAAINGNAAVTDNTATMPTVTQARLGSDGTNYLNGWLQTIRYWPQRIINAEVQAFSK